MAGEIHDTSRIYVPIYNSCSFAVVDVVVDVVIEVVFAVDVVVVVVEVLLL